MSTLNDIVAVQGLLDKYCHRHVAHSGEPHIKYLYDVATNAVELYYTYNLFTNICTDKEISMVMCTGLLQYILKNTDVNISVLEEYVSEEVIAALHVLNSKIYEGTYNEYIDDIIASNNLLAIVVKYSDVLNHLKFDRLTPAVSSTIIPRLITKYSSARIKFIKYFKHLEDNHAL